MVEVRDAKEAAIEQWTADPCGTGAGIGEIGSPGYFVDLVKMREEYAPWMAEVLDYGGAGGLDVLDVGSGQGIDLIRYAEAGARVTGVDLTPRHVEIANAHLAARGLPGRSLLTDAESLPFEEASFDRVSSNGVLHHTPDMPAALAEIWRVLRPGGRATIIVYNKSSLHYWLQLVLGHGILRGELLRERGMAGVLSRNVEYSTRGARPLVRAYTRRRLEQMMREAGFDRIAVHARHFRPADTVPRAFLAMLGPRFRDSALLEGIGRKAGWYRIAVGYRPGWADGAP